MDDTKVRGLAAALLAALRVEFSGGSVVEYQTHVDASASAPINAEGVNIHVTRSAYSDGTIGFAPFTLKTDAGQEVRVTRRFSNYRLGPFKRLTIKNENENVGGIDVEFNAGYGEYRKDGNEPAQIQVARANRIRPAGAHTYAIGDAIGTGPEINFGELASEAGGRGYIVKARLSKSTPTVANAAFRLYLFSQGLAGPTVDGVGFNIPADSIGDLVPRHAATLEFPEFINEGGGGSSYCEIVVSVPFACFSILKNLYGVLVAADTYAAGSLEEFTFTLWAERN
jgi:hypothetical protein